MDIWVVSTFWLSMNICVQQSVWIPVFNSLRNISRSGIARSYDNSMFNFLRDCQTIFQCGHTILHSHRQCMRVPISLHPHQLLFSDFLMIAFLLGMKGYPSVVLICNFLMINDIEHLFLYCVLLNPRQDLAQLPCVRLCFTGKCIWRMRFFPLVFPSSSGCGIGFLGPVSLPCVVEELEPNLLC